MERPLWAPWRLEFINSEKPAGYLQSEAVEVNVRTMGEAALWGYYRDEEAA